MGIIIGQYKDPYKPISRMECHKRLHSLKLTFRHLKIGLLTPQKETIKYSFAIHFQGLLMLVSGSVGTSWNLKNNHPLKINGWLSNGMMNQIVNIGNCSLTSSLDRFQPRFCLFSPCHIPVHAIQDHRGIR